MEMAIIIIKDFRYNGNFSLFLVGRAETLKTNTLEYNHG